MSANLYWEPARRKKYNAGKDSSLKWALEKRFGSPIYITMTEKSISYLQGLADAKVSGAQELIDAIEKYEEIRVFAE